MNQSLNKIPDEAYILRLPEVCKKTGLARVTIYELIKDGLFPKQVLLGSRSVGWISTEIQTWLQERANSRKEVSHESV